jgi:hypothetical protein
MPLSPPPPLCDPLRWWLRSAPAPICRRRRAPRSGEEWRRRPRRRSLPPGCRLPPIPVSAAGRPPARASAQARARARARAPAAASRAAAVARLATGQARPSDAGEAPRDPPYTASQDQDPAQQPSPSPSLRCHRWLPGRCLAAGRLRTAASRAAISHDSQSTVKSYNRVYPREIAPAPQPTAFKGKPLLWAHSEQLAMAQRGPRLAAPERLSDAVLADEASVVREIVMGPDAQALANSCGPLTTCHLPAAQPGRPRSRRPASLHMRAPHAQVSAT